MEKIHLAITGCMGKMGQQLIKSSKSDRNFKIVTITENRIINKKISGIKPDLNTGNAFKKANVIIDFTVPKCTFEVLKIASKLKKKVVICIAKNKTLRKSQHQILLPTLLRRRGAAAPLLPGRVNLR